MRENPPTSVPPAAPLPLRLQWQLADLHSTDGHEVTALFSATVKILESPAERQLFVETFGTATAPATALTQHFQPALQSAGGKLIRNHTVEWAVSDASKSALLAALRTAGSATAFDCGIELLPPFAVEVSSPSLQRQQFEQMQRAATERSAAARLEHFQHAGELLKQWEALRAAAPTLSPGTLLNQLNPADRGSMLQTLLKASASSGTPPILLAVAGTSLIRIDLSAENPQPRLTPLPTEAGPLRSIHPGWVGARHGIMRLNPTDESPQMYLAPQIISEHGFTAIKQIDDLVYATHRDAGLLCWRASRPAAEPTVITPAQLGGSPRHLITSGNSLLFAVENQLLKLNAGKFTSVATFSAPIVAIINCDHRLIITTEDGVVSVLDGNNFQRQSQVHPAGRVTSATLLPWLTSCRIVLASEAGPLHSIGLDDDLIMQYSSNHRGLRKVIGTRCSLAALSGGRDRIVWWNAWEGRQPAGELNLAALARHRVADISFAV